MKSLLKTVTCLLFIGLANVSFSQAIDAEGRKQNIINNSVNTIDQVVVLTDTQKPMVTNLAKEYHTKLDEIRADKATFDDNKKILDATFENRLKAILTADQWILVEAKRKEQK